MVESLSRFPASNMEVNIRCPKCSSDKILAGIELGGYFYFLECKKCGYKEDNE